MAFPIVSPYDFDNMTNTKHEATPRWVSMRIDSELHKTLRHVAADKYISVSAVMKSALESYVATQAMHAAELARRTR